MLRQLVQRKRVADMGVDIGEDIVHLRMVSGYFLFFLTGLLRTFLKCAGQKDHHLDKDRMVKDVFSKSGIGLEFMDEVHKTCLLLRREVDAVRGIYITGMETVIQIGMAGGQHLGIFRINGHHDTLMFLAVDLGKVMTFKLIDQKDITVLYIIEAVVDQKLLTAGDGVIDLVAVMDVHVHSLFIII